MSLVAKIITMFPPLGLLRVKFTKLHVTTELGKRAKLSCKRSLLNSVTGQVVFLSPEGHKSLDGGGCTQASSSGMGWNQWYKCGMFNLPNSLLVFMFVLALMVFVASSGPQKII